jgi:hypothetical protein
VAASNRFCARLACPCAAGIAFLVAAFLALELAPDSSISAARGYIHCWLIAM